MLYFQITFTNRHLVSYRFRKLKKKIIVGYKKAMKMYPICFAKYSAKMNNFFNNQLHIILCLCSKLQPKFSNVRTYLYFY